ncbi:MAG: PQQ-binding-like beta-propeller repeat protein [Puniceicoccaceae bacterium]
MVALLNAAPGDLVDGWPQPTDGIIFGAPAIGPEGEIVVGTEIELLNEQGDGTVYSFNPDGSLRWTFETGSDYYESSASIADDGTVYIGCWDNNLYALDGETGQQVWASPFPTEGLIVASPAIGTDGTIYIGSYDGYLYAINPDGTEKWKYEPTLGFNFPVLDLSPINGSPVLSHDENTVYFGNDNGSLYAINASTGSRQWVYLIEEIPLDNGVTSAPAIAEDGTIYACSENGFIYAIGPDGNLDWKFASTESMRSSPIVGTGGNVYCTSRDGYLYAIDAEGQAMWETFVGDVFYCTPAIDADGHIYVCAYKETVDSQPWSAMVAVNPSGDILWEFDFPGYNDSSPNIAPDGSIYFGAHNGNLYRLEGAAPLASGGWPRFQGNRRQTGLQADLLELDLIDYFPALASTDADWNYIPWFGSGWLKEIGLPWILHEDHGYLYIQPAAHNSVWFWDTSLGEWCYSSELQDDFLFRAEVGGWLFYSNQYSSESGRWFYDFDVPVWIEVPLF